MSTKRFPTLYRREAASSHSELTSLVSANGRLQEEVQTFLRERRQWETERTLFRAMIDQVPDYDFAKDAQCRFILANRAVALDLGHGDPDALLGKLTGTSIRRNWRKGSAH